MIADGGTIPARSPGREQVVPSSDSPVHKKRSPDRGHRAHVDERDRFPCEHGAGNLRTRVHEGDPQHGDRTPWWSSTPTCGCRRPIGPSTRCSKSRVRKCKVFRSHDLGNHDWNTPRLWTLLKEIISDNSGFQTLEVEHDFPAIGRRTVLLDARRLSREGNAGHMILLAFQDITERKDGGSSQAQTGRHRRVVR